jgi:hypothetical protein
MMSDTTKPEPWQPAAEMAVDLFDNWFDPIESEVRARAREFIEEMIRGELDTMLRHDRRGARLPVVRRCEPIQSTPLFDVPIKIENPDEPLGTHVFTLLEQQSEGTSFRWNVVSLPENFSCTSANLNKKPKAPVQASGGTVRPDPLPDDGIAALDRIEIPQDGVARISQLLTPGSSLIVA